MTLAKRTKLPLKLAFAMTINKTKEMSWNIVILKCQNCYWSGILGIAIGRAISIEGLQLVNFWNKILEKNHSIKVPLFYDSSTIWSINPGLSCCRFSSSDKERNELEKSDSPDDDNDGDAHNYDIKDVSIF